VRLFEYQGKELFKKYGIHVPRSILARSAEDALGAYDELSHPVVLKAQVLAGGRGKAGGVVTISSKEELKKEVARIMSLRIGNEKPGAILVEEAHSHIEEMYLSVTLDRGRRSFVVIASKAGGVDVESLSGKIVEPIPIEGLDESMAYAIASRLSLSGEVMKNFEGVLLNLDRLSREVECELAEINPLAVTEKGWLFALDAKIILDDNALFRHPEFSRLHPEGDLEAEASRQGFAFIRLDGDIAVIGNGAGLVLSTLDLVDDAGGKPACFLDLGGGAQKDRVEAALRLVRMLTNAKRILVNIFGGITRTTDVAEGLVTVIKEGGLQPIYARISGAEEEEAKKLLSSTRVKMYSNAIEAVNAVVKSL
jgi:succinyl-CoA synthetase beta subunit